MSFLYKFLTRIIVFPLIGSFCIYHWSFRERLSTDTSPSAPTVGTIVVTVGESRCFPPRFRCFGRFRSSFSGSHRLSGLLSSLIRTLREKSISITRLCNILRFFIAVKMIIFRRKFVLFFLICSNNFYHYDNMPMQYTAIFHGCIKNINFQLKN